VKLFDNPVVHKGWRGWIKEATELAAAADAADVAHRKEQGYGIGGTYEVARAAGVALGDFFINLWNTLEACGLTDCYDFLVDCIAGEVRQENGYEIKIFAH